MSECCENCEYIAGVFVVRPADIKIVDSIQDITCLERNAVVGDIVFYKDEQCGWEAIKFISEYIRKVVFVNTMSYYVYVLNSRKFSNTEKIKKLRKLLECEDLFKNE